MYLFFRANPWRERLIIDKYGPPLTFDPAMPDKDLDFCVYSNREFLTTLRIAINHSHQVSINIYFSKWEGDEPVSQECLDLLKTLKYVEINVIAAY